MSAALLCLLLLAQGEADDGDAPEEAPSAGAASQPGAQAAAKPGNASDVRAELTLIVEPQERAVNIQESWTMTAAPGVLVPVPSLTIGIPKGAHGLAADPQTPGHKASDTRATLEATSPLVGQRSLNAGYLVDITGGTLEMERTVPFATGMRVVVEETPGISVQTSEPARRRTRPLGPRTFVIYDLESEVRAGSTVRITIDGLPTKPRWPRFAALAVVAGLLFWLGWSVVNRDQLKARGQTAAPEVDGALSARSRREQLVKALEVLERDFKEEKIKEKRFERRRGELLAELARVLRELDRTKSGSSA